MKTSGPLLKKRLSIPNTGVCKTLIRSDRSNSVPGGSVNASWFSSYHPYKDHMTWLTDLQAKYSKNSEIITISKSIEGRDVSCIRIFGKEKGKPAIFFMGTLHAREWITTTTTEYIAQNLLENYRKDNDITAALDKYDVYIAPITNPDGISLLASIK